ncbi:MAG: hypothetical protein M3021_04180, partial [Actinomycetota bacterium]|nr:hypothetical protein [Actinomycetota bacterium]
MSGPESSAASPGQAPDAPMPDPPGPDPHGPVTPAPGVREQSVVADYTESVVPQAARRSNFR